MQSANGLKGQAGAKKADGTAVTVIAQKITVIKTFGESFTVPLDCMFLSCHVRVSE